MCTVCAGCIGNHGEHSAHARWKMTKSDVSGASDTFQWGHRIDGPVVQSAVGTYGERREWVVRAPNQFERHGQ